MALLLHVEYDASSETMATKMLEFLSRMADIVHRDHSKVYTYIFRHDMKSKKKLIFTEIYADEQVFLLHASDPEFSKLYQQAFSSATGRSQKELCIRTDVNKPLLPITANILDNYLHVTYIPIQQGFLHKTIGNTTENYLLMVCTDCDKNVYEQLNTLINCVTCVTFAESDGNTQLIAVIVQIPNEELAINAEQTSNKDNRISWLRRRTYESTPTNDE